MVVMVKAGWAKLLLESGSSQSSRLEELVVMKVTINVAPSKIPHPMIPMMFPTMAQVHLP